MNNQELQAAYVAGFQTAMKAMTVKSISDDLTEKVKQFMQMAQDDAASLRDGKGEVNEREAYSQLDRDIQALANQYNSAIATASGIIASRSMGWWHPALNRGLGDPEPDEIEKSAMYFDAVVETLKPLL